MHDICVIGGGIVGLATAFQLLERSPRLRVVLLEKEPELARHQTGHNSGVIHSGIYYRPGSLKAKLCVEGARLLVEFCQRHHLPHAVTGKVVVATTEADYPQLQRLYDQGRANGVAGLALVDAGRLRDLEPAACGLRALHVPGTGIVDYRAVAATLAALIRERGGEVRCAAEVRGIGRHGDAWIIQTPQGEWPCRRVVACSGLQADRVARMAGVPATVRIVPFRGEYCELIAQRRGLVRSMIYPVPNPAFPFLGVHFTRGLDGSVHVGPNAVLALKREGYHRREMSLSDIAELVGFAGFWNMLGRYRSLGLAELLRAWNRQAFVASARQLIPDIQADDLVPGACGIRAQAVDAHGRLLDDFDMVVSSQAIHVRNVPSPAATASLSIGRTLAELAEQAFNL